MHSLKQIIDKYLSTIYHNSIENQIFPDALKQADVIPTHKKDEWTKKRKISSKLYERGMYNQILNYVDKFLSPYFFGFRKGHSTEQCFRIILESWIRILENGKYIGAVLTYIPKSSIINSIIAL